MYLYKTCIGVYLKFKLNQVSCTFIIIFLIFIFTLHYCIGFAIHLHESTTGVHAIPNMNIYLQNLATLVWTPLKELEGKE